MSDPCQTSRHRPYSYHRLGRRDLWLLALTRLHLRGWSSPLIAEALDTLTADAIRSLEGEANAAADASIARLLAAGASRTAMRAAYAKLDLAGWDKPSVDSALLACEGLEATGHRLPWSADQVKHYRRRLRLPHRAVQVSQGAREISKQQRLRQINAGWGGLLPDQDHPERTPGLILGARQTAILDALRTNGSLTRRQLMRAMQVSTSGWRLTSGGRSILARLVRAGVVEERREGGVTVFRLSALSCYLAWEQVVYA